VHPLFEKRRSLVHDERRVYLCDKVMRWYTPAVIIGVPTFLYGIGSSDPAAHYIAIGVGGGAAAIAVSAACYGLGVRMRHMKDDGSTIGIESTIEKAVILPFSQRDV
jgi:hypothetical protein